jgi:hypothetical protein
MIHDKPRNQKLKHQNNDLNNEVLATQSRSQDHCDSDDEYIDPRSGVRQPLVNTDPEMLNLF